MKTEESEIDLRRRHAELTAELAEVGRKLDAIRDAKVRAVYTCSCVSTVQGHGRCTLALRPDVGHGYTADFFCEKCRGEGATTRVTLVVGPLGPFCIPSGPDPRTAEVCERLTRQVFEGEYDHPGLDAAIGYPDLRPGAPRGPDVIDAGAGWGAFSAWALARWPGARVRAYEPHEEAADYYAGNLAEHFATGAVELVRAAITNRENPKINGCEDWGAYALDDGECGRPVARVRPLDLPPCDVLKADVEGSEVELLAGYPHMRGVRVLLVEFHGRDRWRRVEEIARACGFRLLRGQPDEADYGPTVWAR